MENAKGVGMDFNKDDSKQKKIVLSEIKAASCDFIKNYYKVIGSVTVLVMLCIICIGTLIVNEKMNDTKSGIMITLSDVAAGKKPFAGKSFETTYVAYEDIMKASYDVDELARLEKAEKQIEEILASRDQSRKDLAALEDLTAQNLSSPPQENAPSTDISSKPKPSGDTPTVPAFSPEYPDETGEYAYVGEFTLTGYCPCPICCGSYSNMENPVTASGTIATPGRTIAADTSIFPFGTKLLINGQIYTVEDRGGAIKGNRIDIFFATHQEALIFGRRGASVYIVQ